MRDPNATQPIPGVDPLVGTSLGEYRVLERIGEGGMGVVYRGVQPVIKKRVAVKVLKANVAGDPQHVRRLTDEAEAVNSIRHRNIIDIFSLGQLPDGRPYIVMEFLEGQPLDAYLRAVGQFELPDVLSLLIALCGPLAAAHRANVIHRDLKPSNIFVCKSGDGEQYLKLLDFGLAKKSMNVDGTSEQTSRAAIIGTPNYMAPEQARGDTISARTDIYALGVMAYELLTGELPYVAPGPMEVLMLHVSGPIPSVRDTMPSLPEELAALVRRMMAKEPEARVGSVDQVRQTLIGLARQLDRVGSFETLDPVSGEINPRRLLSEAGESLPALSAAAPLDPTLLSARTLRGGWQRPASALLGLVVVLGGALWWVLSSEPPRPAPVPPPVVTAPPPRPIAVERPPVEPPPVAVDPVAPDPVAVVVPPVDPPPVTAPAEVVPPKRPRVKKSSQAPTALALKARLARLEKALAASVAAGEDPDPAAMTLLRKYRVESTMVDTAEDRARLAGDLDQFERTFLPR